MIDDLLGGGTNMKQQEGSDRTEYWKRILTQRSYVYNKPVPVKNPNGMETLRTVKLSTPHMETHAVLTNRGPGLTRNSSDTNDVMAAMVDRSVALFVRTLGAKTHSDAEFQSHLQKEDVKRRLRAFRIFTCLVALVRMFIYRNPAFAPDMAMAQKMWDEWDNGENGLDQAYGLPKPSPRKNMKRVENCVTMTIVNAVAQIFFYKNTSYAFDCAKLEDDGSGGEQAKAFHMTMLWEVLPLLQPTQEIIHMAWSFGLNYNIGTSEMGLNTMTVVAEQFGMKIDDMVREPPSGEDAKPLDDGVMRRIESEAGQHLIDLETHPPEDPNQSLNVAGSDGAAGVDDPASKTAGKPGSEKPSNKKPKTAPKKAAPKGGLRLRGDLRNAVERSFKRMVSAHTGPAEDLALRQALQHWQQKRRAINKYRHLCVKTSRCSQQMRSVNDMVNIVLSEGKIQADRSKLQEATVEEEATDALPTGNMSEKLFYSIWAQLTDAEDDAGVKRDAAQVEKAREKKVLLMVRADMQDLDFSASFIIEKVQKKEPDVFRMYLQERARMFPGCEYCWYKKHKLECVSVNVADGCPNCCTSQSKDVEMPDKAEEAEERPSWRPRPPLKHREKARQKAREIWAWLRIRKRPVVGLDWILRYWGEEASYFRDTDKWRSLAMSRLLPDALDAALVYKPHALIQWAHDESALVDTQFAHSDEHAILGCKRIPNVSRSRKETGPGGGDVIDTAWLKLEGPQYSNWARMAKFIKERGKSNIANAFDIHINGLSDLLGLCASPDNMRRCCEQPWYHEGAQEDAFTSSSGDSAASFNGVLKINRDSDYLRKFTKMEERHPGSGMRTGSELDRAVMGMFLDRKLPALDFYASNRISMSPPLRLTETGVEASVSALHSHITLCAESLMVCSQIPGLRNQQEVFSYNTPGPEGTTSAEAPVGGKRSISNDFSMPPFIEPLKPILEKLWHSLDPVPQHSWQDVCKAVYDEKFTPYHNTFQSVLKKAMEKHHTLPFSNDCISIMISWSMAEMLYDDYSHTQIEKYNELQVRDDDGDVVPLFETPLRADRMPHLSMRYVGFSEQSRQTISMPLATKRSPDFLPVQASDPDEMTTGITKEHVSKILCRNATRAEVREFISNKQGTTSMRGVEGDLFATSTWLKHAVTSLEERGLVSGDCTATSALACANSCANARFAEVASRRKLKGFEKLNLTLATHGSYKALESRQMQTAIQQRKSAAYNRRKPCNFVRQRVEGIACMDPMLKNIVADLPRWNEGCEGSSSCSRMQLDV